MKNALITGASGGLGLEFAKIFAKENYNLILIARNKEKLEEIKKELENEFKILITTIEKDLSQNKAAEEVYKELKGKQVNILINNAGFATHGNFSETPLENEVDELMLNIVALTSLTKLIVRDMIKREEGKILNVASTAAFAPGPLMSVYYASKAYVLSFSEGLSEELKGTGVFVTALCPGPTDTGFAKRAGVENTMLFNKKLMDPKRVATVGYKALMSGKKVVIPGARNNVASFFMKHLPHKFILPLVKRIEK